MKLGKRSRWSIVVIVLVVSLAMVLAQTNVARAAFTGVHTFNILMGVETEIMQKTPAGQYYEALFWKHNDEIMQIMDAHPEHNEEFVNATLLFVPELDSLVNGDGDKAYVTAEHVVSLQSELDWFASVGSPALQADIQRELERMPLETFVGMSMTEALEYINSDWSSDSVAEKNLVPDSDGKWTYYVQEGIYLEYPYQYTIQISESEKEYVYFIPTTNMPEPWHPFVMKAKVWEVPSDANTDVHTWYSQANVLWETPIQNADFQGFEFIQKCPSPSAMNLHAFLYNQQNRLAIDIWVFVFEPPPQDAATDYRQLVNQRYEYFQRMVESLRIQKP